jgi:hypothetical protein
MSPRVSRKHESGIGNARLEWSNQDLAGRIASGQRRAVKASMGGGLTTANPRAGIAHPLD